MKLRDRAKLRSYQRYAASRITDLFHSLKATKRKRGGLLLAAEMSLGKTGAVLTALSDLLLAGEIGPIIIVAPLRVAEETWPDEIKTWAHTRHMSFAVATGTVEERAAAVAAARHRDVLMINRENLPWLWKHVGGESGWIWDVLVYDESSRLKGFTVSTEGGKEGPQISEFGVLVRARLACRLIIELSGTPSPNGVWDLGGQMRIIDGGEALGKTKTAYERTYFKVNKYSYKRELLYPGVTDEIMEKVSPYMVGLRAEDYIDLPPVVFSDVIVNMPKKALAAYQQFERDSFSEDFNVEAVNKGVLINKLLQFANGSMYRPVPGDKPGAREVVKIHDAKLDALDSIIAEAAGNPIMVAYQFQFDRDAIRKRFKNAVVFDEERDVVKKWNAGKIPLLLAHPASIGHGLNLQFGGHLQVWYGLTWSLELWLQFNRRLARPLQSSEKVWIYRILARNTYDMIQKDALALRDATQNDITDRVRVRRDEVLRSIRGSKVTLR